MTNAKNDDPILFHAIAQDIGPYSSHLAAALAGIASALRKFGKAVGDFDQPFAQTARRRGIEGLDIFDDCFEMRDGFICPDDAAQFDSLGSVADTRPLQAGARAPGGEPAAYRGVTDQPATGNVRLGSRVGSRFRGGIAPVEQ